MVPDFPGQFFQFGASDGLAFTVGDQDTDQDYDRRQGDHNDSFQWYHTFRSGVVKATLVRSDVHIDKDVIDAQAAVLTLWLVRIDLGGGVPFNFDLYHQPVAMLAFGAAVFDFWCGNRCQCATVACMLHTSTVIPWPSASNRGNVTGHGTNARPDTATQSSGFR